jgi:preprotein translocase subunit SecG
MTLLMKILIAVQILSALAMTGLILLQHGKGADMGAAFGSGASGSLFGASGSANVLSRTTAILAVVFFSATLAMAKLGSSPVESSSSVLEAAGTTAPATSATSAAVGAASAPASAAPGSVIPAK